jgi:hypothetical protein
MSSSLEGLAIKSQCLKEMHRDMEALQEHLQRNFESSGGTVHITILGDTACQHPGCAFRTKHRPALREHLETGAHFTLVAKVLPSTQLLPMRSQRGLLQPELVPDERAREWGEPQEQPVTDCSKAIDGKELCQVESQSEMIDTGFSESLGDKRHLVERQIGREDISTEEFYLTPTKDRPTKEERRFICDRCPKRFTRSSTLREHQRTHNNDRPFACAFCPKNFVRLKDRNRHQTLHNDKKKFVCKGVGGTKGDVEWGCGRGFAREDGLVAHLRTNIGWNTPYHLLDLLDRN